MSKKEDEKKISSFPKEESPKGEVVEDNKSLLEENKWVIFAGLFIISLWAFWLWIIPLFKISFESAGQLGDMFGSLNALFSGLAFCGIIYTIFLQQKELSLQREELKLQREEQKQTREEFSRHTEIFEQQKFESTFFRLLEEQDKYRNHTEKFERNRQDEFKIHIGYKPSSRGGYTEEMFEKVEIFAYANDSLEVASCTGELIKYSVLLCLILKMIDSYQNKKEVYLSIFKIKLNKKEVELLFFFYNSKYVKENKEILDQYAEELGII